MGFPGDFRMSRVVLKTQAMTRTWRNTLSQAVPADFLRSRSAGGMVGGTDRPIPPVLTTLQIKSAKPTARAFKLADTGGLFLLVQPNGSKLWRYKFRLNGVEALQALGAFPEVTLADARHAHAESRKLVAKGVHPVQARREERESRAHAPTSVWADYSAMAAATRSTGRGPGNCPSSPMRKARSARPPPKAVTGSTDDRLTERAPVPGRPRAARHGCLRDPQSPNSRTAPSQPENSASRQPFTLFLLLRSELPVTTVDGLIDWARARGLNHGSTGV